MELQQLLSETAQRKASDLHLKSGSKPILRIHGHLEVQDDLPMVTREFIDKMAESLLGERRLNMLMEGREMDLGYMLPGIGRFRCNLFLAMGEVRGVFRHVPERIPAFQELGRLMVLRISGNDGGPARDLDRFLTTHEAGLACYRRLSPGHYAWPIGDAPKRSTRLKLNWPRLPINRHSSAAESFVFHRPQ